MHPAIEAVSATRTTRIVEKDIIFPIEAFAYCPNDWPGDRPWERRRRCWERR